MIIRLCKSIIFIQTIQFKEVNSWMQLTNIFYVVEQFLLHDGNFFLHTTTWDTVLV
jgi:hypothetical protein